MVVSDKDTAYFVLYGGAEMFDEEKVRIARIKSKLIRNLDYFGNHSSLKPCLTVEQISAYEQRNGVYLPDAFRHALLEIGPTTPNSDVCLLQDSPDVARRFPVTKVYERKYIECVNSDGTTDWEIAAPELDTAVSKHGSILIERDYYGNETRLIITGEARGQVWRMDNGSNIRAQPIFTDYLAWYEEHLDFLYYDDIEFIPYFYEHTRGGRLF